MGKGRRKGIRCSGDSLNKVRKWEMAQYSEEPRAVQRPENQSSGLWTLFSAVLGVLDIARGMMRNHCGELSDTFAFTYITL